MNDKYITVGELFSGYGSQELALKYANIPHKVLYTSDIDVNAILAYATIRYDITGKVDTSDNEIISFLNNIGIKTPKNISTNKLHMLYNAVKLTNNYGDISLINDYDIPYTDLLTYSFPCTQISRAGKMTGMKENSGTKSSLIHECKKIIKKHHNKYLLMENVSDLLSKKHIEDFLEWCKWLENEGYTNSYKIMKASDYGVPQNRSRVFMISILNGDKFEFPQEIKLNTYLQDLLEDNAKFEGNILDIKSKNDYNFKDNTFNKTHIDLINIIDNEIRVKQNVKIGYIKLDNFTKGGICDLSYPTSKLRRGRVQGNGKLCPTLTASQQALYLINNKYDIRKLTNREEFRLMGVKDEDIDKILSLGLYYNEYHKLAGNSIVTNCMVEIFKKLFNK